MIKKSKLLLSICAMGMALLCAEAPLKAHDSPSVIASKSDLKVGVINFKKAVEISKVGKREQGNFEALKKQMDAIMEEKEKGFNEIAAKFNDPDYLDGLSDDAERELKHKYRTMGQEIQQIQTQYYQTLQQANMKIVQDLHDFVAEAASEYAKETKYDLVFNEEGNFFYSPALDITKEVVGVMDKKFDAETKESKKS